MAENYMQDEVVRKYYKQWTGPVKLAAATLLDHPLDRERFYKFVKACMSFAGNNNVGEKLDTSLLRLHLHDDFKEQFTEEYYEKITHVIIVLFESLFDYENTAFP